MTIETLTRQTRRSFLATGTAALAMPVLSRRGLAQQTYT